MCTTTQAIYVPKDGIDTPEGKVSFDEFAQALATATSKFLSDNDRACMVLGAIQSEATAERINECRKLGEVVLESESRTHAEFPNARIRTPLILKVDGKDQATYAEERFGPISFLIATESTDDSMRLANQVISEQGAITLGVYSTSDAVLDQAEALALEVKVALSCNLDGGVFVNQSAAFSDFHATGGNPAANACLTDTAFLVNRFVVVQSRRHV
jgi:phenylacetic acid degradation protein paaN